MFVMILASMLFFIVVCLYYLWLNDWAKETADVIVPIIGALGLTGYAMVKLFILDVPEPLKFSDVVAIKHQARNGIIQGVPTIHAMFERYSSFPKTNDLVIPLYEFRGTSLLIVPFLHGFALKNHFEPELSKPFGEKPPILVSYILEYGFLSWLSTYNDLLIGATERNDWGLISKGRSIVQPPEDLIPVLTLGQELEKNPFLNVEPLTLRLPKGSKVGRDLREETALFIRTPHSTLKVKISPVGMETLENTDFNDPESAKETNSLNKRLTQLYYRLLRLIHTDKSVDFLYAYRFEFEFFQNSDVRFSKQAKKEAKWGAYLQTQFTKDFSWNYLSKRVLE